MATLRKGDMSAKVSTEMEVNIDMGEKALNAVLSVIKDELAKGNRIVLTGFGTFEVRDVKARNVRAIRGENAGKTIEIPAHKRVGFSPGTELKKAAQG